MHVGSGAPDRTVVVTGAGRGGGLGPHGSRLEVIADCDNRIKEGEQLGTLLKTKLLCSEEPRGGTGVGDDDQVPCCGRMTVGVDMLIPWKPGDSL